MYCPRTGDTDISKCLYGHEIDKCNKPRCYQGPGEECVHNKILFGKHCDPRLRCTCNFCQGCIDGVCARRTCGMQMKRVPTNIHSIAELLRQQEQEQQQQQQLQQFQFEQEEQRQLQDLLQQQSERHAAVPLPLSSEFNNLKSILIDRATPYYPFNNSNEIIFNN